MSRPRLPGNISRRVSALLTCGVLLGTGAAGTAAYWSTSSTTQSGEFTTASLKITASGSTDYAFPFPASLLPGDSSAALVNVENVGTVPFDYVGSVHSAHALGRAVTLTVRSGGTVDGGTCSGGTPVVANRSITGGKAAFTGSRGPLSAQTGAEALCLQITLPETAAGSLAGSSGSIQFTFDATGTS
ncbi:hypothetical protein [Gordonia zhaorongruii]|uniref:hypothetical protein n=1 Tax=Gordonia zhaorongruii TaxID=2597659 RepID=UPI0010470639|nr:hypothetical protein [Gordonia zhaorongruii]